MKDVMGRGNYLSPANPIKKYLNFVNCDRSCLTTYQYKTGPSFATWRAKLKIRIMYQNVVGMFCPTTFFQAPWELRRRGGGGCGVGIKIK